MCRAYSILVLFIIKCSSAMIYKLNASQYYKMPPLYAMDNYQECMQPGGLYCLADYDLHSNEHSNLMDFIKEYSAVKIKHFNHSQIHRATCVTMTCSHHLNDTLETTPDLNNTLERCINESIWKTFNLEVKLSNIQYCKKYDDMVVLDTSDYIVAVVHILILILNVVGSYYDVALCGEDSKIGNKYLLAFSLKRNWAKLVARGGSGPDPRLERLKSFNGLRALTMVCVIFSHTALIMTYTYVDNPLYIEQAYDDYSKQILFNGTLVTYTFLIMSSFLLAFNLKVYGEKQNITWVQIPKGILLRWIRLTPSYALVIATISTWIRHAGNGPLWNMVVTSESESCRQYWWTNILYFNNYIYGRNMCFAQAWFLAADTQLFVFSLILFVIVKTPRYRTAALTLMFLASLVISIINILFFNLNAIVIQSPESFRNLYIDDDTFKEVYITGHNKLSAYVLGLAAGFLTYKWQTEDKDVSKYKKYRWIIWAMFPTGVVVILSGGIFYINEFTPSTFLVVLYATLHKPIFQACVASITLSSIFKIENVYRSIIEWRGFTWLGRVSYCAFLLHTTFQKTYIGSQTELIYLSDYNVLMFLFGSIFASFIGGAVLWLLVEAPMAGLTKTITRSNK